MGRPAGGVETRAEAKRAQVLAGARAVFLREGFAAASMDVISDEARVSKRTLYAYYPSKEELFADVLRGLTTENPRTQVLDFVQGVEPRSAEELHETLLGLAKKLMATIMDPDYLALLRTIIADSHRVPQLGELFRSTVPEIGIRAGSDMIRRAQENGVAVRGDPEVMTRMFIGSLLTYALTEGLFRPGNESEPPQMEKVEEIVGLYMRAISAETEPERSER